MMKFLIGINNKQINPEESKTNAASHYAWCLNNAIIELDKAKDTEGKITALKEFHRKLLQSNATQSVATDLEKFIAPIIISKKVPSDEYIISCLMGIPINFEYISYEIEMK